MIYKRNIKNQSLSEVHITYSDFVSKTLRAISEDEAIKTAEGDQ